MKIYKIIILCLTLAFSLTRNAFAQSPRMATPKIIEKDGRHALLVDGKPYLILGGQVHNSSAWPGMLPGVWRAATQMHLNTLEIPIYWEQIEDVKGKFDFSLIDTLLIQARAHKVRLVLLWFATWKNGSNHYMPGWMKRDAEKYPNITGKKGQPVDSPSPNIPATLTADINAFTQVMRYLKKADPQRIVIMVQVENESGAWDSMRDYSAIAQKLFDGQVPHELLKPEILRSLNVSAASSGTWKQVFGERADEYFHAWSVSHFIGQVAAAGKKEYPLPMYVNAALRDPFGNPMANTYESGGPTDNVIPIWKVAAPAIDLLAPDIYLAGSKNALKVLELYNRPDNPLFVPEAALIPENAKYFYEVIARGGIGFSPFGIDGNREGTTLAEKAAYLAPFSDEYSTAAPFTRQLAQWAFEGKIKAVTELEDHAQQTIDLGAWQAIVSFGTYRENKVDTNAKPLGKLMIVQLSRDKFMVMGALCHITFKPLGNNSARAWQYIKVEEGTYINGSFKSIRILNGDETDWGGPRLGDKPATLMISLVVR